MDDRPALENKAVRDRIATWHCEQSGLHFTKLRVQSAMSRGETPGPENSITKIVSANKLQGIGSYGMDLMDMGGILVDRDGQDDSFYGAWLSAPGLRIAGGTDEILRNIIAERVLGLPGDVRVDKSIPFTEVPQGGTGEDPHPTPKKKPASAGFFVSTRFSPALPAADKGHPPATRQRPRRTPARSARRHWPGISKGNGDRS